MGYCEGEPPATVLIAFKNGKKEEVVTSDVPVTVGVRKKAGLPTENPDPDSPTGGCCDIPYKISFSYQSCSLGLTPNTCGGPVVSNGPIETGIVGKIVSARVTQYQGTDNAIEITRRGCDGKEEKFNLLGMSSQKLVSYTIHEITRADGKPDICTPPDEDSGKCVITVKNASGGTVYTKTDECPINYKVRCGDNCAEGEIRCQSNQYPGYCCIDCGDLARNLRG